ncbi:hypothetical protein Vafri_18067 [Volvox africanus]|uniref:Uncharacterized protein n=1 Tax=Volvox africanus TaxID=51714 RepID=A0A8J4BLI8_9CHLO|nr:hypothetical protein Vafri_18067 [Volvox africanus]
MASGFLGTMVSVPTLLASGVLQQLLSLTMLCVLAVWLLGFAIRRGLIALLRQSWRVVIVLAASACLWWTGMGPAERLEVLYELLRRAMFLGMVSEDDVQRAGVAAAAVAHEPRRFLDTQTIFWLLIRGVTTPAIFWLVMAWLKGYRSALPQGSVASITTPQARDGSGLFFASNRFDLDWLLLRTIVSVGVLCCTGSLRHSTDINVALYGVFLLLRLVTSNVRLLQLLRDEFGEFRFSVPTPRAAVTNRVVGRAASIAASNGRGVRRQLRAAPVTRGARIVQPHPQPRELVEAQDGLTGSLATVRPEGATSQSALVVPRQSQAAFNILMHPGMELSHETMPTAAEEPHLQRLLASSAAVSASAVAPLQRSQVPQAGSATRAEASPNWACGTAAVGPSRASLECLASAAEANRNGEGYVSPTDASILTPELEQSTTAQLRAQLGVLLEKLHNIDTSLTEVAAPSLEMQAMLESGDGSDGVQTGPGASSTAVPLQVTPIIVADPTPSYSAVSTATLASPQQSDVAEGEPTSESVMPSVDCCTESQPTGSAATSTAAVMTSQAAILPALSVTDATINQGTPVSPTATVSTVADVLPHPSPAGAPSMWPSFAAEMRFASAAAEGHGLLGGSSQLTDNPSTVSTIAGTTPGIFRFVGQQPPADSGTVSLTVDPGQRWASHNAGSRSRVDNGFTAALLGDDVSRSDGSPGARPVAISLSAARVISETTTIRCLEVGGGTSGSTVTRSHAMAGAPILAPRGRGRGSLLIAGAGQSSSASERYETLGASASTRTDRSSNGVGSVRVAVVDDSMRLEGRAGNDTGHVNSLAAELPRVGGAMGPGFGLEAGSGAGATNGIHTTENAVTEDLGFANLTIGARVALATADRLNTMVATAARASASAGVRNAGRGQTNLVVMPRRGGIFDGLVWAFTFLTLAQWALHVPPWSFTLAAINNLLGWLVPTLSWVSFAIAFSMSVRLVLLYRAGRLKHALLPCNSIYGIWDVRTSFCFNVGVLAAAQLPALLGDRWASIYTVYLGLAANAELIARMALVFLQAKVQELQLKARAVVYQSNDDFWDARSLASQAIRVKWTEMLARHRWI